MIRFIDRYELRKVLRNGEVLVWDFKEKEMVLMTTEFWEARKNFLLLEVDGQIL